MSILAIKEPVTNQPISPKKMMKPAAVPVLNPFDLRMRTPIIRITPMPIFWGKPAGTNIVFSVINRLARIPITITRITAGADEDNLA